MSSVSAKGVAAQAAARLNLTRGRDGAWRGPCPCCNYAKPTLAIRVRDDGIAVSCVACGESAGIAVIAGIPPDLLVPAEPKASKLAKALNLWTKGAVASGTPVERYINGRGVTIPVPPSIRYLARQRNWTDGQFYPAMISLVERVPGDDDRHGGPLLSAGIHLTFLQGHGTDGAVRKAATGQCKLSLGQLRYAGVIGHEMVVAEGIETALSVMQITGLPTAAALSAAGMRAFRWPPHVRKLWIAADNDPTGRQAADMLLGRALAAGLMRG